MTKKWIDVNDLSSGQYSVKNKTGTIIKLNKKNFEDEELPHELFLTTSQTTKIRNAFANNMLQLYNLVKFKYIYQFNQVNLLSFGQLIYNLGKKKH